MTARLPATDPECAAPSHASYYAWSRGCICVASLEARERRLAHDREVKRSLSRIPELEVDFVSVYAVTSRRAPYRSLSTELDRAAAVAELARRHDLCTVAAILGITQDRVRRLYAQRESVAA